MPLCWLRRELREKMTCEGENLWKVREENIRRWLCFFSTVNMPTLFPCFRHHPTHEKGRKMQRKSISLHLKRFMLRDVERSRGGRELTMTMTQFFFLFGIYFSRLVYVPSYLRIDTAAADQLKPPLFPHLFVNVTVWKIFLELLLACLLVTLLVVHKVSLWQMLGEDFLFFLNYAASQQRESRRDIDDEQTSTHD